MIERNFIKRLTNPGTVITLASLVVLLLTTMGYIFDGEKVVYIVRIVCGILITMGLMNNPDTPGLDIPGMPRTAIFKEKDSI